MIKVGTFNLITKKVLSFRCSQCLFRTSRNSSELFSVVVMLDVLNQANAKEKLCELVFEIGAVIMAKSQVASLGMAAGTREEGPRSKSEEWSIKSGNI